MARPAGVSTRPKRTPIGARNILNIGNKEAGYHYRIVSTDDKDESRLQRFLDNGYEVVPDAQVGDKRVENPSTLGSAKTVPLGSGRTGVVLRIKEEWYKEDQAAKQAEIDALEEQRKNDVRASNADYGKFEITRGT